MSRVVSALLLLLALLAPAGLSPTAAPAPAELSEESVQALLIWKVAPVYPPLARQARIQGTVMLKIVINKDGDVRDVQLYSGHPMLAPAAMDAVKQWKYQPYTKDEEVVEVSTVVRVIFSMPDGNAASSVVGAAPGGVSGTVLSGIIGGVRASEAEMRAQCMQQIDPVYPRRAIQDKLQGPVMLDA